MTIQRRNERGFTLIELMIAITILGLLTSLGFGLLHLGARSWDKMNRTAEGVATIEAVQNLLRQEIAQAYPEVLQNREPWLVAFKGDSDTVVFEAPLPKALETHGLAEIRLFFEDAGTAGKRLMMAWRRDGEASVWHEAALLSGIEQARWAYYGIDENKKQRGWQSIWHRKSVLPQAIRLDVAFPAGDTRRWPEFIAAPKIGMDAACVYDPTTKGCRGR